MKMLVTIGPISKKENVIKKFSQKTNLFRLNGSHEKISWHKETISLIRKICPNAFILMDIPGIKPRTANFHDIEIKKNQLVVFGKGEKKDNILEINLTRPIPKIDKKLDNFSLSDGHFNFGLVKKDKNYVIGRSYTNFTLLPKKGINFLGSKYDENEQFKVYKKFINQINELDIDAIGLSFVQTGDLVNKVRNITKNLVIISKIENSEGLANASNIIKNSDAIMIDRGDLSAEIGLTNLYNSVEKIADFTKSNGKPLIMATENLESMVNRSVPSKSEVMSIAHSASIGVDCIMLSEETALAKNGIQIVDWLSNFLLQASTIKQRTFDKIKAKKFPEIWEGLEHFNLMPKLLMTKSGYALFDFLAYHPNSAAFVITNNKKIINVAKLFANEITIIFKDITENIPIEILWKVIEQNKNILFNKSNKIVAIYVSKYVKSPRANCITIFDKNDFI